MSEYRGEDALRAWLVGAEFTLGGNKKDTYNECNWYAWRRSKIEARRCELNSDKQGLAIVLYPYSRELSGRDWRSVEVELYGVYAGISYKLMAYSITPDDVPEKLGDVERGLIAAWNALEVSGS
jgi:hypothetical protein